jgi:hypothetical protein
VRYTTDDMDMPDVRVLSSKTVTVRKARKLNGCGHYVMPGVRFHRVVSIVDGEFDYTETECDQCWDEVRAEEEEAIRKEDASLEQTEEDRKYTAGTPWENA